MAGNYNQPDVSDIPFAVVHKFVVPSASDK